MELMWREKKLSLRWDDAGGLTWGCGVEERIWDIIKARSENRYGQLMPREPERAATPLRADQQNLSGEKPANPRAYLEQCRAYLQHRALQKLPSPPQPLPHKEGIAEHVYAVLSTCQSLEELTLDFPGAVKAFVHAVLKMEELDHPYCPALDTIKKLTLRNGNERLYPPPTKLFVAIGKLRGLEELRVRGECGGREGLFPAEERMRRGIYAGEGGLGWWGWDCEALEMSPKPEQLRTCEIFGLPGLGPVKRTRGGRMLSLGVWRAKGWPGELMSDEEGKMTVAVKENYAYGNEARKVFRTGQEMVRHVEKLEKAGRERFMVGSEVHNHPMREEEERDMEEVAVL
ncbi:hypothetical protein BDZ91DRAFT_136239 [Kalaharituber pfeilii]|nr:hypothetical protein BDZ91DRAFT_136239 [Kalaharituber pfeilii]